MGRLLRKEVDVLLGLRNKPKHPFVAVLGGCQGVRQARRDRGAARDCRRDRHRRRDVLHLFPRSGQTGGCIAARTSTRSTCVLACWPRRLNLARPSIFPTTSTAQTPSGNFAQFGSRLGEGSIGYDIGPGSAAAFTDVIMDARMVFWNGPMGMFEDERFRVGDAAPWRRRWPTPKRSPSSAVATLQRLSHNSSLTTRSIMCRPAEEPASSFSRTATSPALQLSEQE